MQRISAEKTDTLVANLLAEINSTGLARYDPTDVMSSPAFSAMAERLGRPGYLALRLAEHWLPMTIRRVFRVDKTIVPTTYWHILETYRHRFTAGHAQAAECLHSLALNCIENGVWADETLCWPHPFSFHGAAWRSAAFQPTKERPDNCAHNTARNGLALLNAAKTIAAPELCDAGIAAARAMIKHNNWFWYDNGDRCAVSYYPSSQDEVINTGADVALLLASAYQASNYQLFADRARGLLSMVIAEQNADGSWQYATKAHENRLGPAAGPDNHHHAMTFRVLAKVLDQQPYLFADVHQAQNALIMGIDYYLKELSESSGYCRFAPRKNREADIAGYCEGALALGCAQITLAKFDNAAAKRVERRCNAILRYTIDRFVRSNPTRVISRFRFGTAYDIGSIRWGSGLLLEALTQQKAMRKKEVVADDR
ncbi:MAG: hypothetical protein AAF217_13985 [Pseudomonadota bacterium]